MRWFIGAVFGVLALVVLAGGVLLWRSGGSVAFAVANLPTTVFPGEIRRGVVFDAETGLALDIYRPAEAGPHPVVVFYYGGRWTYGRREDYAFAGAALAEQGYIVVIPDYRKYPEVRFPVFVEDGAAAAAWAVREVAGLGGDPERIFLSGHSAGAHIAALILADPSYLAGQGAEPSDFAGLVGLAGPYHFTPKADDLVDMFGPPARFPEMQAGNFLDGSEPPILMLWGDADVTVGEINMQQMEAAAAETGACVARSVQAGVDHVGLVASLAWVYRAERQVFDEMLAFFQDPKAICRDG